MIEEFWDGFSWGTAVTASLATSLYFVTKDGIAKWPEDILAVLLYFLMVFPMMGPFILGMFALLSLIGHGLIALFD